MFIGSMVFFGILAVLILFDYRKVRKNRLLYRIFKVYPVYGYWSEGVDDDYDNKKLKVDFLVCCYMCVFIMVFFTAAILNLLNYEKINDYLEKNGIIKEIEYYPAKKLTQRGFLVGPSYWSEYFVIVEAETDTGNMFLLLDRGKKVRTVRLRMSEELAVRAAGFKGKKYIDFLNNYNEEKRRLLGI